MMKNTPFRFLLFFIVWISTLAVSCNKHKDPSERPEYFIPVMEHAWKLADSGLVIQAFTFLDNIYDQLDSPPGKYDRYRKYNFKAHHLIGTFRDYDAAHLYVDSMLLMLEGKEEIYINDYLSSLLQKGYVCFHQNRYAEAFLYYHKGQMAAREYGSQCHYANLTASLGRMTYRQGKYSDAIPYFREAFIQADHCDSTDFFNLVHLRQEQLANIGLAYEQMGLYDSAIILYNHALDYIARNAPHFPHEGRSVATARAVIYGNLGSVYLKTGAYEKSRQLLGQSIQINNQPGYDHYDARLNQIKLADLLLTTGRYTAAGHAIKQIRAALDTTPFEEAELRWRRLAWRYHDVLGDVGQAYRSYQGYIAFKDSFEAKRRELPGMSYELIFDNRSKQYQIDMLQKDNRLKALYLMLATLVSVMAVVIFFLVRKNYLQSRHNVAKLTALNRKITGQNMHLQQTLDALEDSQQAHTRIIKAVAHDLRNPISAMVGIADLLLMEPPDSADRKEMIEMIKTSGMNAIQFMEDLLHDSAGTPLEPVALDELIGYSVELMRFRAAEKNQQLIAHLQPVHVQANRQKLWRVLNNLIVNAIKFTPGNKTITIGMETQDGKVVVAIRDEGIGIPDEIKDSIFDTFTSARRTGTSGEPSFGMGLAITKQIIEAHNGRIWFETEVGKGTVFYIELPSAPRPADNPDTFTGNLNISI